MQAELHEEVGLADMVGTGAWSEGLSCQSSGGGLQLLQGERKFWKRHVINY